MTNLTIRALGRLRLRMRRRRWAADDLGLETAEVLLWLAATAGIILALSTALDGILQGVLDEISGLLG